ncbi:MAG: beta-ketoacyl-[acyl-carrier-protein] synthase family protein [Spirochaetales bacterium]|nr:beta-ketoacyl-[acyl-carrier-protein] synthase family protein [Spirochaetales bacterium]
MKNRVAITGIGIITPLGSNIEDVWKGLLEGRNGITLLSDFDKSLIKYGMKLVGLCVDFNLDKFQLGRNSKMLIKKMNFLSRMLVYAGLDALDDAGISFPEETRKYRVGAIIGTGTALADRYSGEPYDQRNPKWFLETYPNIYLSYLANIVSLNGYASTIVSACTSGTQSIGEAYKMIQDGRVNIMLAGGIENKFYAPFFSGFSRLYMSTREEDPETAMRPFDKDRSGFVLSKGAAILVLESYEHAINRGARVRAFVEGYGSSINAESLTDASYKGIIDSMEMAIKDAGIEPGNIDYINAHGSSTISNDREESIAIKKLFGDRAFKIPVNSTKSMLGHSFAACGAIESAVCVKSLEDQQVHLTRNFKEGDLFCDLDYVKDRSRKAHILYCMNNTSGIGGYNASLIFKKV